MKKETSEQRLIKLKKRYEGKYIDPLRFKFTRPPILFDRDQVALVKQIEASIKAIECAEICPLCGGGGVTLKKNDLSVKGKPSWNSPLASLVNDHRGYVNDLCTECLGEGIVFPEGKTKRAINGLIVKENKVDDLVCCSCSKYLRWSTKDVEGEQVFQAECCKVIYNLHFELFRVESKLKF